MLQGLPSYQTLAMPTCGLLHVGLGQAGGVEHGLGCALRLGLGDVGGVFIEFRHESIRLAEKGRISRKVARLA